MFSPPLLLAAEPFFPPWYFWLFVFSTVIAVFTGIVVIVYLNLAADTERLRHERETAARLIEVMLVQRKMTPEEIDQVLGSYRELNTFWQRFKRLFKAVLPAGKTLPTKPEMN
jgi:hypothetical protein